MLLQDRKEVCGIWRPFQWLNK